MHFEGEVRVSGHVSALQERSGEAIGFSESERQGRASHATLHDGRSLDMSLKGSSPQGEEDTRATCQILKERLNLDGGHWDRITFGCEPADCVLVDAEEPTRTLDVQVVRAIASQGLWRRLNFTGFLQSSLSPVEAVAEIRMAIEAKARDEKIPRQSRSRLVLALDATRLPGLTFDEIVHQFRLRHLDWVRTHGFAAVWLVGPVSRLVWRLD